MEIKRKFKRLLSSVSVSTLAILGSVGNAFAASDNTSFWSGLSVRQGLAIYVDKLDPMFQPTANYIIDHVIVLVIIGTLLLIWYHSLGEKNAKRSGSISGQAQHESKMENAAKNFGMAAVFSLLVLLVAGKCLM